MSIESIGNWKYCKEKSINYFKKLIWPKLSRFYPRFYIQSIENNLETEFTKNFYIYAIIDVKISDSVNIISISSRVQETQIYREAFFIQLKRINSNFESELSKKLSWIIKDSNYATITVQAFVFKDHLLNLGLCKTQDLLEYLIHSKLYRDYEIEINFYEKNPIYILSVPWKRFQRKFKMKIISNTLNQQIMEEKQ